MATQVERVIPLAEAATRMGIPLSALTHLISNGVIKALQLPDGTMVVGEQETRRPITKDKFLHLHGVRITVGQAESKYSVPRRTIERWVTRRFIAVLRPGFRMELDEQDVAYCASIYHERKNELGTVSGSRLFDKGGRPYQLEYPDLAEHRRKRKASSSSTRTSPLTTRAKK